VLKYFLYKNCIFLKFCLDNTFEFVYKENINLRILNYIMKKNLSGWIRPPPKKENFFPKSLKKLLTTKLMRMNSPPNDHRSMKQK